MNQHDGWKSRKLWFALGSTAFSLVGTYVALYFGKVDQAGWITVAQWVPSSLLLIFGSLETAKSISAVIKK